MRVVYFDLAGKYDGFVDMLDELAEAGLKPAEPFTTNPRPVEGSRFIHILSMAAREFIAR